MSNITNYYSVTDNIFQLIVDFWHMLLVNDDDDVGFSLAFLVRICYVLRFFGCACGCVHDNLAQYAIHIVTIGVQLDERCSFSGSLPHVYLYKQLYVALHCWQIKYD